MAWWNVIGNVFSGGREVAEVFTENREKRGQRRHAEVLADIERDRASLAQFAAEFHARSQRTRWDSFVDGMNRLPRPLLTLAILGFFVLAPLDPVRFLEIARAYELMPPGYWALLSVIIGFYFGGRMQLKAQDMRVRAGAVQAARDLVTMRREFRALEDEEDTDDARLFEHDLAGGALPPDNRVIRAWLDSRRADPD